MRVELRILDARLRASPPAYATAGAAGPQQLSIRPVPADRRAFSTARRASVAATPATIRRNRSLSIC